MTRQFIGRNGIRGIVGVVGFGESDLNQEDLKRPGSRARIREQACSLGKRLAEIQSVHLLTGGGGGVMAAVCEGYYRVPVRAGLSIAVIPGGKAHPHGLVPGDSVPAEYPNPWVEIPIFTHLTGTGPSGNTGMNTRNHISIRSSDVLIVLPGGKGTDAEMQIAAGKIPGVTPVGCPCAVYLVDPRDRVYGNDARALTAAGYTVVTHENAVMEFIDQQLAVQRL
jgi:predicted Rossmann-fold nucleotide-binding protein